MPLTDSYSLFHKINTILPRDPNSVDQLQTSRIRSIAGPRYVVCDFDSTHTLLLNIGPFDSLDLRFTRFTVYSIYSSFDSRYIRLSVHSTLGTFDYLKLDGRTFDCHKFDYRTFDCRTYDYHIQKTVTRLTEHTIERTLNPQCTRLAIHSRTMRPLTHRMQANLSHDKSGTQR